MAISSVEIMKLAVERSYFKALIRRIEVNRQG